MLWNEEGESRHQLAAIPLILLQKLLLSLMVPFKFYKNKIKLKIDAFVLNIDAILGHKTHPYNVGT